MNSKKGVTLIELVMAIVITSICVLPIMVMFQEVLLKGYSIEMRTQATSLAEGKMDSATQPGFSLYSNSTGIVDSGTFPSPFTDYTYQVEIHFVQPTNLDISVDPTATDYKNVAIRINRTGMSTVTVTTLLCNN